MRFTDLTEVIEDPITGALFLVTVNSPQLLSETVLTTNPLAEEVVAYTINSA